MIQADEIQSDNEVLALASKDHATAGAPEYTQPESLLTWQPAPDIESSLDEVHADLGMAKDPELDLVLCKKTMIYCADQLYLNSIIPILNFI